MEAVGSWKVYFWRIHSITSGQSKSQCYWFGEIGFAHIKMRSRKVFGNKSITKDKWYRNTARRSGTQYPMLM